MSERVLAFEGVENFRDYGDYSTAAGRRLKRGRLLRSGHHARASDADLQRLSTLNISAIVDLRRSSERAAQPSRRCEGFCAQVIETGFTPEGEAPHVTFLRTTDLTEETVRGFMLGTYRSMPFEGRHLEVFGRYFRALADADGPVLIHCAAGKDRTGLLAALTHHLAGVNENDLYEDYLLTNSAVRLELRAPEVAAHLERLYGRTASDAAVRAFLGVEPAFLDAALSEIKARRGTLDAYLEQDLGVDGALRERLEAKLLA
jgi:protein tyrosine/serine phosphatase